MKQKLLLALCACMLLGGCGSAGSGKETGSEPTQEITKQNSVEMQKLGSDEEKEIIPVELEDEYQKAAYFADQVYNKNHSNVLVSPLSLDIALGLAYEGASGTTKEELQKYLGREDYGDYVEQYLNYANGLKGGSNSGYSFAYELANSIWVKKERKLKGDYQKTVEEKYQAVAENVDFVNNADATAKKINNWCDKKTHGMIKELVSPQTFSDKLEAILMNSVYFESPWQEEWSLEKHEFTDIKGAKETKEMLFDVLDVYYENEHATAFAKDYYNGFQFIGILPKQEGEFSMSDLDLKSLLDSRSTAYDVYAFAPKLDYETTASNIMDILKAQGVRQAFDRYQGQFDQMVEDKELYVSDILQKCKIEMDDQGTRAAAVTAVIMYQTDCYEEPVEREKKEVYLDRPFAFLIYDSVNDKIVFAGKVIELMSSAD